MQWMIGKHLTKIDKGNAMSCTDNYILYQFNIFPPATNNSVILKHIFPKTSNQIVNH